VVVDPLRELVAEETEALVAIELPPPVITVLRVPTAYEDVDLALDGSASPMHTAAT
jgi:hypothetical protein